MSLSAAHAMRRWMLNRRITQVFIASILFTAFELFAAQRPLEPLSAKEISSTVQVLKDHGKAREGSLFPLIVLREPPKEEVLAFEPEKPMRREAFAMVHERAASRTFEAIVDLNRKALISWREIPGAQPPIKLADIELTEKIVRADPKWQEAMKKRGITDFERVAIDPWPAGRYGLPEDKQGIRFVHALSYYNASSVNQYARPIEGVTAYVDLNAGKVFKLVDTGVVPLARATADLDEPSVGKLREPPKALQILQPQGSSFEVTSNEVHWQNWRFRFGMHPREGLVLYRVGYEDQGKLRPVVYRASLSEMVVPYGDSGPNWFFRNVFDEGEYGLGWLTLSLEPLADAPPNATFFDTVLAADDGKPYLVPRAVALYERDGGILWRHLDLATKKNESRRSRELVLMWIATVGNYDYGFNWIFHQDGTLEMEVDMTGIMEPKGVHRTDDSTSEAGGGHHGHLVADSVEAVHHEHFFNFRLDMDVDGADKNSVVEVETVPAPPGPQNPYHSAFSVKETVLRTEQEGERHLNLATARKWKVINLSVKNALGQPVGYLLVPGENSAPYAALDSPLRKRAGFLNAHLWVTRYDPTQMYAAGDYVSQGRAGDGLPKYVQSNRSIEGQDIVLWYTMGITHITRPEDWPVMPVHRAGFKLVPSGFFSRNPALDVPKPSH